MPEKKEGLLKSFGLKMAIIIVMSSIIGSGVFKKAAPMSAELQLPWLVVLAWVLAGVIILFGVWSIAELGTMFPHSGGPFSWLEKVYGKSLSFLYGWSCFTVIQTAAIASVAFVFAGALDTFIPLPHVSPELESFRLFGIPLFRNIGAKIVSCVLILMLTFVNIKGAKKGGSLSLVFTFSITICIVLIICAAFSNTAGSWQTFSSPGSDYPSGGFGFLAFISVMVIAIRHAFWGYEGWIALGFIGEELKHPKRDMPKAMTIGILLIIVLYALINTAYLYVMPVREMLEGVAINENKIAAVLVIDKIFGEGGAYIVSFMILISTFGCTNATILVSSRIYYAMAQKGLFFKGADRSHPKNKTPHNALKYQAAWACILTFSGSFDLLTDLVIIAAFIFYGLIVLGVIILRYKLPFAERPYRTLGYPTVPVVFVLFCLVLLGVSFYESPQQSLIGLVLILSGLPFYFIWKRSKTHLEFCEKETAEQQLSGQEDNR